MFCKNRYFLFIHADFIKAIFEKIDWVIQTTATYLIKEIRIVTEKHACVIISTKQHMKSTLFDLIRFISKCLYAVITTLFVPFSGAVVYVSFPFVLSTVNPLHSIIFTPFTSATTVVEYNQIKDN
ncbi:hypothetical protein [Neobacillus endophyticus]|uniref:hypothetical protein n=1 Tax=Neobacillus endophyticus TaxID=2738405 RepID=UPI001C2721A0|nr:hypothetical protein [Neobacillus endophyticus]